MLTHGTGTRDLNRTPCDPCDPYVITKKEKKNTKKIVIVFALKLFTFVFETESFF